MQHDFLCGVLLPSVNVFGECGWHLDSWNKELELTCARNFALKIGTPVGSLVKERCAKNGENGGLVFEIWAPGGGAHVYPCSGFYNPLGRRIRVQVGWHT